MKKLESLNLDRTKITDVGLKTVGEGMTGLKTLSVVRTGVTESGVKGMTIPVKWGVAAGAWKQPATRAAGTQAGK